MVGTPRRYGTGVHDDLEDLQASHVYDLTTDDDEEGAENAQLIEDIKDDDFDDSENPIPQDNEVEVVYLFERQTFRDNEERWMAGLPAPPPRRPKGSKPKRQAFVAWEPRVKTEHPYHILDSCVLPSGDRLLPGNFVEVRSPPNFKLKSEDFFKIKKIFELNEQVILRGWIYRRTNTLEGMLSRNLNEVYQVLQRNLEDPRDIETQSLHDIPLLQVWRVRELVTTNCTFPEHSFRDGQDFSHMSSNTVVAFAKPNLHLTCRWQRVFFYKTKMDLEYGVTSQRAVLRITETECAKGFATPDAVLRGAYAKFRSDGLCFGDIFAGAGGVSSGAREAGFSPKFAVDKNGPACRTYRLNFRDTQVFEEEVFYYLTIRDHIDSHTCVIHISSVCKTLSPAHTVQGQDDDDNAATLYVISDILTKNRPRICTLEQTAGALQPRHMPIFNSFVQQFTIMGYSVRWGLQNLSEFGVPQSRKRLIMIASCPGHPLPDFPKPTHGPGLLPFVTVAEALAPVTPGLPNHILPKIIRPGRYRPYSPHQLLPGCITTTGGQNWHPNGARLYTVRELACLQTFPLDHVFIGTRGQTMCQVGNAVPPRYSKLLYQEIMKVLLEVEQVDKYGTSHDQPILLDDEEDVQMDLNRITIELD
ncbi:S-adenosyl-L-methionine-dependent methyltransferase [Aureobasidium pullulans]|uniref:DNA (cytosine-5-)-methyltransferase n=1 Tax=Aureobasidium pullulans TaxID=5580 RepID=A0A4S9C5Z4_AURPU|nr:S-adenosyl-L-methionine-dependent methyltransferase [Aureobasidium pullulans]